MEWKLADTLSIQKKTWCTWWKYRMKISVHAEYSENTWHTCWQDGVKVSGHNEYSGKNMTCWKCGMKVSGNVVHLGKYMTYLLKKRNEKLADTPSIQEKTWRAENTEWKLAEMPSMQEKTWRTCWKYGMKISGLAEYSEKNMTYLLKIRNES
jgi:hypothetical protein